MGKRKPETENTVILQVKLEILPVPEMAVFLGACSCRAKILPFLEMAVLGPTARENGGISRSRMGTSEKWRYFSIPHGDFGKIAVFLDPAWGLWKNGGISRSRMGTLEKWRYFSITHGNFGKMAVFLDPAWGLWKNGGIARPRMGTSKNGGIARPRMGTSEKWRYSSTPHGDFGKMAVFLDPAWGLWKNGGIARSRMGALEKLQYLIKLVSLAGNIARP